MEKPKVRFSQNPEYTIDKSSVCKKVNHAQEKGKVKVKSIVPVSLPIKLLKNGKRLLLKDHENTTDIQIVTEKSCNGKCNSQHLNDAMYFTTSETNGKCTEMEPKQLPGSRSECPISETPLNYVYLTQDESNQRNKNDLQVQKCTDKLQRITIAETDKECNTTTCLTKNQQHNKICNPNSIIPFKKSAEYVNYDSSSGSNQDIQVIKVIDNSNESKFLHQSKNKAMFVMQGHNMASTLHHEGKENKNKNNDFFKTSNKSKTTTKTDILKDATCSSLNTNVKISSKKPVKVQKKLEVMPCAKYKLVPSVNSKHAGKPVKTHVKTRSLFNIAGKASNVMVQPEISDASPIEHSKCHLEKTNKNTDITSKNLLSHPEYNSTVCVMKKMKEIEEEKLVKDVESLPDFYKNLVHGKVRVTYKSTLIKLISKCST